jgi:hypothetical protein
MDRVRYKRNSALDQVRVELESKLGPVNVPMLGLLGRDGIRQEVGPGEEPATTEDVEDVECRQIDVLRSGFTRLSLPCRWRGRCNSLSIILNERGNNVLLRGHGSKRGGLWHGPLQAVPDGKVTSG